VAGSVRFAVPIQKGQIVQLTESTREQMIADVHQTLANASNRPGDDWHPAAGLVFSCATRKHILGTQTAEEIRMLRTHLPRGIALMGFYSFGEISPLEAGGPSVLHSCTFITLLIGENNSRDEAAVTLPVPAVESAAAGGNASPGDLARQIAFLERKLVRSEYYRERLEYHKDLSAALLRKINPEISQTRLENQAQE
jgi:hypothetical protein